MDAPLTIDHDAWAQTIVNSLRDAMPPSDAFTVLVAAMVHLHMASTGPRTILKAANLTRTQMIDFHASLKKGAT